eukprot:TRINITY_DN11821_c0_g1_i1.p1 TRINITY_DN11821_c0_g1~~TRINITY_DN11821_c0_g1_i1.p1  ORF type:complete len:124 (-),score=24.49 TRINITY_DN11821_c0_g1_i1:77-448(-)
MMELQQIPRNLSKGGGGGQLRLFIWILLLKMILFQIRLTDSHQIKRTWIQYPDMSHPLPHHQKTRKASSYEDTVRLQQYPRTVYGPAVPSIGDIIQPKKKRNSELLTTLYVLNPTMGRMIKSG